MNQYEERNYAAKNRKVEKGDLPKHSNGSQSRETSKASCCDSLLESRKVQEIIMQTYGTVVQLTEDVIYTGEENEGIRKEDLIETHQEGRQGISFSDQRGCKAEETDHGKTKGEEMKKQTLKEKKHEAKETKAYEKKEDKKESKGKKK